MDAPKRQLSIHAGETSSDYPSLVPGAFESSYAVPIFAVLVPRHYLGKPCHEIPPFHLLRESVIANASEHQLLDSSITLVARPNNLLLGKRQWTES